MTELPGDLRARFDAAVPLPALDGASVTSLLHRARRRRRIRLLGGGVSAVAVVAAIAVGGVTLVDRGATPPVAPPVTPPPAETTDTTGADLWLSDDEVPPGADVIGVLIDEAGTGEQFDQLAAVERWTDGEWVDDQEPLLWCLPTDECSARVMAPGTMVDFAPEQIVPGPGAPGPAMRMSTEGLEPGWYRLRHVARSGAIASAVLRIDPEEPSSAPLPALDETSLVVSRPVLTTDPSGPLVVDQAVPDGDVMRSAPAERARVDLWVEGSWVTVQDPVGLTGDIGDAQAVTVLGLDPGAYRVVLSWSDDELWGPFWVIDAPRAPSSEARREDAVVLEAYTGLPDDDRYDLLEAPIDTASYLFIDGDRLLVSLAGTGECTRVPVATQVSGRELAVVVREPAQACPLDGTFTTYVLALPAGVAADAQLTTLEAGGVDGGAVDDAYAALRLWLDDVVAETGLEVVPVVGTELAQNATVVVRPRGTVTVVAEFADEAWVAADVVPDDMVELDGVVLETGTDARGAAAARFGCGTLAMTFLGPDATAQSLEDVQGVARDVARAAQPCPADVGSIGQ